MNHRELGVPLVEQSAEYAGALERFRGQITGRDAAAGKCQIGDIVRAYQTRQPVEVETFSPYLADHNLVSGEIDDTRLLPEEETGLMVGRTLRELLPDARVISLYDEYNSGLPDSENAYGAPTADGPQIALAPEVKQHFRTEVERVMRQRGIIGSGDQEGVNYEFISESEKIHDAEELVRQLEGQGCIRRDGQAIYFSNPAPEQPAYREVTLRTKGGRWLCEALDASSYLKPENRAITHLVVLPEEFRAQQDKVWEVLKALAIVRPNTYHNIFFDKNLPPEAVAQVVREEFQNEFNRQSST